MTSFLRGGRPQGTWCKRNNTAWSESIHQEYGFKQPYTRKFRCACVPTGSGGPGRIRGLIFGRRRPPQRAGLLPPYIKQPYYRKFRCACVFISCGRRPRPFFRRSAPQQPPGVGIRFVRQFSPTNFFRTNFSHVNLGDGIRLVARWLHLFFGNLIPSPSA